MNAEKAEQELLFPERREKKYKKGGRMGQVFLPNSPNTATAFFIPPSAPGSLF